MTLVLACSKCGIGIPVDDETIKEAAKNHIPLSVEHDVCPDTQMSRVRYRFIITVFRETSETTQGASEGALWESGERVAQVGATVEAPTFVAAMPRLTSDINKQWEKVVEMAEVIDQS